MSGNPPLHMIFQAFIKKQARQKYACMFFYPKQCCCNKLFFQSRQDCLPLIKQAENENK